MKVEIPRELVPWLEGYARAGILGSSADQVAITLIRFALMDRVREEYLRREVETRKLLRQHG